MIGYSSGVNAKRESNISQWPVLHHLSPTAVSVRRGLEFTLEFLRRSHHHYGNWRTQQAEREAEIVKQSMAEYPADVFLHAARKGLRATTALATSVIVGRYEGEKILPFGKLSHEDAPYAIFHRSPSCFLVPESNAREINHSCAPNCVLRWRKFRLDVITVRPVTKGEELTICYNSIDRCEGAEPPWDLRWSFTCTCGSTSCQREVRGWAELPGVPVWDGPQDPEQKPWAEKRGLHFLRMLTDAERQLLQTGLKSAPDMRQGSNEISWWNIYANGGFTGPDFPVRAELHRWVLDITKEIWPAMHNHLVCYVYLDNPRGSRTFQAFHTDYTLTTRQIFIPLVPLTLSNSMQYIRQALPKTPPKNWQIEQIVEFEGRPVEVCQSVAPAFSILSLEANTLHRGIPNTGDYDRPVFVVTVDAYPHAQAEETVGGRELLISPMPSFFCPAL